MNVSAIAFQNQVGDYLYSPLPEPVMVENQGQTIGVFLGYGAYQQLVQRLEDAVWGRGRWRPRRRVIWVRRVWRNCGRWLRRKG